MRPHAGWPPTLHPAHAPATGLTHAGGGGGNRNALTVPCAETLETQNPRVSLAGAPAGDSDRMADALP